MLCHDGDYVVVLTVSQKHNLRNRTKRSGTVDINPAFSASTWHCWVKSFKVWWLGTQGIGGHCIETSNLVMGIDIAIVSKHWIRTSSFLEFRRANRFTETALKLHWMGPKTGPATKLISRLQRLIACYIHTIIYYTYIHTTLLCSWTGAIKKNQQSSKVSMAPTSSSGRMTVVGMLLAGSNWSPTCINHHPEAPLVKWDSLPRWDLVSRFVCSSAVQRSGRSAQATYAPLLPSTY